MAIRQKAGRRASLGRPASGEPWLATDRLGWSLWKAGRTAEALATFERERAIWRELAAAGPADASDSRRLANCETNTAAALVSSGRLAEARACCDRAIAIREDLVRGDPDERGLWPGPGGEPAAVGRREGGGRRHRRRGRRLARAAALYAGHPPGRGEPAIFRACCRGSLAGLAGKAGSGISAAEGPAHAEEAMAILRRAVAGGYRDPDHLRVEPGLDPLRSRDDFRLLMMDLAFPDEPFAPGD